MSLEDEARLLNDDAVRQDTELKNLITEFVNWAERNAVPTVPIHNLVTETYGYEQDTYTSIGPEKLSEGWPIRTVRGSTEQSRFAVLRDCTLIDVYHVAGSYSSTDQPLKLTAIGVGGLRPASDPFRYSTLDEFRAAFVLFMRANRR